MRFLKEIGSRPCLNTLKLLCDEVFEDVEEEDEEDVDEDDEIVCPICPGLNDLKRVRS